MLSQLYYPMYYYIIGTASYLFPRGIHTCFFYPCLSKLYLLVPESGNFTVTVASIMLLQNVVHDSTYVAHNTTRDVWSHIVSANEYRTAL